MQAFCALLFNRTAVQRMSLAPRQLDYSVTAIPRVNPSNTQLAPNDGPCNASGSAAEPSGKFVSLGS